MYGFNADGTRRIVRAVRNFEQHEFGVTNAASPSSGPFLAQIVSADTINANNAALNAAQGLTGADALSTSLTDYTDSRYYFVSMYVNNSDTDPTTIIGVTMDATTDVNYYSGTVTNLNEDGTTHNIADDSYALIFPADSYVSEAVARFAMFA